MAINLANAGFDLIVYDIREEPLRELSRIGREGCPFRKRSWGVCGDR